MGYEFELIENMKTVQKKAEGEKKCTCCGWDNMGYMHEPMCDLYEEPNTKPNRDITAEEPTTSTEWANEFDEVFCKGSEWVAPNMKGRYIKDFIRKAIATAVKEERERVMVEVRLQLRSAGIL